ncbi:mitochondrial import inner membrane translocase subunit Tim21-like [Asterias rubens]|uniref:mitochondrial import inner membrane translocase subunit Tim21-like n=1 Tax=Asterias rubens TaxID=7604 RepID=UPI0014558D93|nr:mitochondrial import inner membrane translocase subunit Tim21-like [Asterias rubens]XP_033626778.1 mitochondrial import inner membrane translocase subunit Tim21-like [Asterias rubens]
MSIFVPIRASSWTQTVYQLATKSFPGQCYNYKFISTVPSHQSCVAAVRLTPNKQITTEQSFVLKRFMATEKQRSKQVAERVHGTSQGEITLGRKVVQAGKDASYMGIVIVGIGVTAIMFYAIGRELFASSSPNAVYTKAYKLCSKDDEIIEELGQPIKGFGETTRRGRRRHVSHLEFEQDGVKHMRMKFYIQGPKRKGTVQLEVQQGKTGRFDYRYLFVEMDGYPHRTIVLEDNR